EMFVSSTLEPSRAAHTRTSTIHSFGDGTMPLGCAAGQPVTTKGVVDSALAPAASGVLPCVPAPPPLLPQPLATSAADAAISVSAAFHPVHRPIPAGLPLEPRRSSAESLAGRGWAGQLPSVARPGVPGSGSGRCERQREALLRVGVPADELQ